MNLFYTIFLGFGLSFLGQLPLGTISLTATQIAVQENFISAWKYSIGVALIEMICLRLVLSGMHFVSGHTVALVVINWITVVFFFVLGVISIISAARQSEEKR